MKRLKKLITIVLIAAIVSVGIAGCHKGGEHPSGGQKTSEHPAGEHPK